MTPRRRLPNRRAAETLSFIWPGMQFTPSISRCNDGKLAEIFLTIGKVNSQADAAARDRAVVASLAIQHGSPLETIRGALMFRCTRCRWKDGARIPFSARRQRDKDGAPFQYFGGVKYRPRPDYDEHILSGIRRQRPQQPKRRRWR